MIELNTQIESLGRVQSVRIANMALRWCKKNLGVNGRKKWEPIWYVRKGWDEDGTCGEYDATDNEVYIFWNNCEDVEELI